MIIVDIYVLALDEVIDFQLDANVQVSRMIKEITEMLGRRMREKIHRPASEFLLCIPEREEIIPYHATLAEYGVKNGSRLLLV